LGDGFEKLQIVPIMIITPMTFLAAASTPSPCCRRSGRSDAVQPVVYLINGFRWSFYGISDVSMVVSVAPRCASRRCVWPRVVDLPDRLPAQELTPAVTGSRTEAGCCRLEN